MSNASAEEKGKERIMKRLLITKQLSRSPYTLQKQLISSHMTWCGKECLLLLFKFYNLYGKDKYIDLNNQNQTLGE